MTQVKEGDFRIQTLFLNLKFKKLNFELNYLNISKQLKL